MGKIDEVKEHIGALKTYMSIIIAIVLAMGAGVAKLYDEHNVGLLFWLGIIIIVISIAVFVLVSRSMHDNIKKLKDL